MRKKKRGYGLIDLHMAMIMAMIMNHMAMIMNDFVESN